MHNSRSLKLVRLKHDAVIIYIINYTHFPCIDIWKWSDKGLLFQERLRVVKFSCVVVSSGYSALSDDYLNVFPFIFTYSIDVLGFILCLLFHWMFLWHSQVRKGVTTCWVCCFRQCSDDVMFTIEWMIGSRISIFTASARLTIKVC